MKKLGRGLLAAALTAIVLTGCRTDNGTTCGTCVKGKAMTFMPADDGAPYAVCAHVARGGEHEIARKEFALMAAAGIGWARTDFDWSGVEKKKGEWSFEHLDETIQWAEDAGVKILPILDYDVKWASPAYKHLDEWSEYVRRVVTRYKDRIRYWEIYNEQNLEGFWREKPNAANYAILLKAAYQEIKKVDPELTVLIGGFAGIPWEFIEGVYQADGAPFFDVMNVHPYRYPKRPGPGKLYEDIQKLRDMMTKYGDAEKPIWITEIGWPTHSSPADVGGFMQGIVKAGMKAIAPERTSWTAALLQDPDYSTQFSLESAESARKMLQATSVRNVTLSDLPTLDPAATQVLCMPPSEGFPADSFGAIEAYVRKGGVLMLWSGVPLYYAEKKSEDGTWERPGADESYRRRLRIGWEAWWTKDGIPKKTKKVVAADEWKGMISFPKRAPEASRFLTDSALKPGDRFVPLVRVDEKDYKGACAAAYALNSDMKGGVIVSTFTSVGRNVTPERQGQICPRAYLIARQAGVKRMFWYEFQATEQDPFYNEAHFGMVHRDLTAKPAYTAVKALTRARPAGSANARDNWRSEDGAFCFPHWKRPDGQMGWAIWKAELSSPCQLTIRGTVSEAFDHLGKPVSVPVQNGTAQIDVGESILYLVGPEDVTVSPR